MSIVREDVDTKILQDNKKNNYLVILRPGLEGWILKAAQQSQVNPQAYGLSNRPKELHSEISVCGGPGLDKFGELLSALQTSEKLTSLKGFLSRNS